MQDGLLNQQTVKTTSRRKLVVISLIGVFAVVGAFLVFTRTSSPLANLVEQQANIMEQAFTHWSAKYNRLYLTEEERTYRLGVFESNVKRIKDIMDEGPQSFTMELNDFADLTVEEFRAQFLKLNQIPRDGKPAQKLGKQNNPDSIDWRAQGAVTPMKNQGACGSCWAFSAVGPLEALWFQHSGELVKLSEQQLVDCSTDYGNQGCNGGLMTWSYQYVMESGIMPEDSYPYKAKDQKCKYDEEEVLFWNEGFTEVEKEDSSELENAVAKLPTSVAVQADSAAFQFYKSGVLDSKSCGTNLNHGITAVGYDSTAAKPHWIVKNSWGSNWGEGGYVKILKESGTGKGICGIAMDPSFPYGVIPQ